MARSERIKELIIRIVVGFLIAIAGTLLIGYFTGFHGYLVVSGSSLPYIEVESLVLDYKVPEENLHVGDFITFQMSKSYTTHKIVAKCGEGDYQDRTQFNAGELIYFVNEGVKFERKISSNCTIVTMATNFPDKENLQQEYEADNTKVVPDGTGSMIECINYSQVGGKVMHCFPKTGALIFRIKERFIEIVAYILIAFIAENLLKFAPDYVKLF